MPPVYKYKPNQPVVWHHNERQKSNHWCLYCSEYIGPDSNVSRNKEHLIGKKFVPSGNFEGGKHFNFLFSACEVCNTRKSQLEGYISATTQLIHADNSSDEKVRKKIWDKAAKARHPDTNKSVIESYDEMTLGNDFIKFGLISPPRLNRADVYELSFRHIQGLFSLSLTQDATILEKTRVLSEEHFHFWGYHLITDWGNPQLLEVIRRVAGWSIAAPITTANGYYKAILRCNEGSDTWFWALEWNKSYRVIGAIGKVNVTPAIFEGLPELNWVRMSPTLRRREEIPLKEAEDFLFNF